MSNLIRTPRSSASCRSSPMRVSPDRITKLTIRSAGRTGGPSSSRAAPRGRCAPGCPASSDPTRPGSSSPGQGMTNTAPRVEGVSGVSRDDVEVQVVDRLARGGAGVEADVVAVGAGVPGRGCPSRRRRVQPARGAPPPWRPTTSAMRRREPRGVPGAHRKLVGDREGDVVAHDPLPGRNLEERRRRWCRHRPGRAVIFAGHVQTLRGGNPAECDL